MTRYDPAIHDPRRLVGEDAAEMDGFDSCAEAVRAAFDEDVEARAASMGVGAFARAYLDVAEDVREAVMRRIDAERVEQCISMMDESPETYAEKRQSK